MIYFTNQVSITTDTGNIFLKNGDIIKELPTGDNGDIYVKVFSEERFLNINFVENVLEFSSNLRLNHNISEVKETKNYEAPFYLKKENAFTTFSWCFRKFYIYLVDNRYALYDVYIIQRSLIEFIE